MRRIITAMLLIVAVSSLALSGGWTYSKSFFPVTGVKPSANGVHGVAVDGAGNVWVIPYDVSDSIYVSLTGKYAKCRVIYVMTKAGVITDSIKTILVGSVRDTLWNSARGLTSDYSGNIYLTSFDAVYKINYQTKVGIWKIFGSLNNTGVQVGVTGAGEVYTGCVIPGSAPINIFASNGTLIGTVDTAKTVGYSRALAVSKNANDVYWSGYTNGAVWRYKSTSGSLGPYSKPDTILKGMNAESFGWNPKTGYLWVSAGYPTLAPTLGWFASSWYAYNPATNTVVDGFTWNPTPGRTDPRPRGIAFSLGGDTAYAGAFNLDTNMVQMWVKTPTSVEEVATKSVPTGYALEQNFPNPFNPSTEIRFTIAKAGLTQLFVVDMLGRDVATLLTQDMQAGTYKVRFDASKLPSGTYIYTLRSGDAVVSKKMMLLK
jgi:hypothetical protein